MGFLWWSYVGGFFHGVKFHVGKEFFMGGEPDFPALSKKLYIIIGIIDIIIGPFNNTEENGYLKLFIGRL